MPENQTLIYKVEESHPVQLEEIPMKEVLAHNTLDDLWVVIDKEVYDLSSFATNHPGGQDVLLRLIGKDGKKMFDRAKHSEFTKIFALNYRIGKVSSLETS